MGQAPACAEGVSPHSWPSCCWHRPKARLKRFSLSRTLRFGSTSTISFRLKTSRESGPPVAFTQLTRDAIAIQTEAGEKRFTRDTVRAVAVRGHALRKGALIGAGVFAALGAWECWGRNHGTSRNCASWPLLDAVLIGAPLGLVAGELIPEMHTIYGASANRLSISPSRDTIGAQASLLEDLALRVNLNDQLRVDDRSGVGTTGRLTRLTADEITLQTAAGEKHFTRESVRQVAVRRQPLRMAVLIGAGVGAATGAVAACTGPDREECADAPIMAGAFGAGLGLGVGALIHRTTIVYPEPEKRTFIVPAISRGAVGVWVSRRW